MIILNTMLRRQLEAAKAVAMAGPGVGGRNHNRFKIGAVLFGSRGVVNAKHNSYKTHPMLTKYTNFPFLHAETACILGEGLDHCHGLDLIVVRLFNGSNSLALAKPCNVCQEVIKEAGLRNVYYSNNNGKIEKLEM